MNKTNYKALAGVLVTLLAQAVAVFDLQITNEQIQLVGEILTSLAGLYIIATAEPLTRKGKGK